MRPRTEHTRLLIAVIASVLAHAVAIVAFAGSYGTFGAQADDAVSAITNEDEPEQIHLGIEQSEAQTVDWIGYDQYQRHIAPRADQSQAQMTLGAARASAPTPPAPQPAQAAARASEAVNPAADPAPAAEPVAEKQPRSIEQLLLDQLFATLDNPALMVSREPSEQDEPEPSPDQTETEAETETKTDPKAQRAEAKPDRPRPEASPPAPPTAQSTESETVDELEGDSDKDADAVSKETDETVTEYTLGKPLAAQGLNIRTIRPVFSVRTTLLARPKNPKIRIHFNRTGKVTLAVIEESTGEPDVDRPLLDAIYQWRAVGDRLLELAEPVKGRQVDTIAITLTIKLH